MVLVLLLVFLVLGLVLAWFLIRVWYFRLVARSRAQVRHQDGQTVPGQIPKLLVGNMVDVYRSPNRLSAYHHFHEKFGEIVQIFWMWRQQISVTNYRMVRQILVLRQRNYEKFRPNWLIQRLYGSSVLTNSGEDWKRQRLLMNEVFSKKHIDGFHDIFVSYSEGLADKWDKSADKSGATAPFDIYPDLIGLFLDIIGKTAIGHHFGALAGEADAFLESLNYILKQSTQPLYQFTTWWRHLPLPANRRLARAFETVDYFLNALIRERKEMNAHSVPEAYNVLDLFLQATNFVADDVPPLTDGEVRDNLLAIIVNGHETVATSVSLALYLLARDPEKLGHAQAEVDRLMEGDNGQLTKAGVSGLHYLEGVVNESLRVYPPMSGLQRISVDADVLEGWSIPSKQVVGIPLTPLHMDSQYFGECPEEFRPERYLDEDQTPAPASIALEEDSQEKCPMSGTDVPGEGGKRRTTNNVRLPLTFGGGSRKCLGRAFAMYEMKVALAVLLHRFDFRVTPDFDVNPELGKFGLFISMFPKGGVHLVIGRRDREQPSADQTPT